MPLPVPAWAPVDLPSDALPAAEPPSRPLSVADERGFAAFWQEEAEAPERGVARDLTATVFGALGVVALLALYLVLVG